MGRSLGLEVVAEGVETPEQLAIVRECECHLAQGFYLCRPQPPDVLAPKLAAGAEHQVLH
jgi:EAL domain-containing protein (putative c-di-GMP-specific phosphodiesterase class I)